MLLLPTLLALSSLPLSTLAHLRIPLTLSHPPSLSSRSGESDGWTTTVSALEHLEAKYVKLYDEEVHAEGGYFEERRRERLEARGRGREAEEEARLGKRATGTLSLTNVFGDATYIAAITVGGQSLNVILDTGSSDLWLADSSCSGCTGSAYTYSQTKSTTKQVTTTPFAITYGSGTASGTLAKDTVTLGPFSVSQTFGLVTSTSSSLIFSPLAGIMGMAFQAISTSGAVPFWLDLVSTSKLDSPLMAFYLTRHYGSSSQLNAGGECTLGYTDSSLYTGDINYVSMPSGSATYWLIPFDMAIVSDTIVTLASNTNAAIDTGTTLIVGPTADVKAIYAQIDGSQSVGGGHWIFPCASTVSVSFVFGGTPYALNSADMSRGTYATGSDMCVGAISASDLGSSSPMSWIIGAAFLKNVYTVFRQSPASIGFALLSSSAGGSPDAPDIPTSTAATSTAAAASKTSSTAAAASKASTTLSSSAQASAAASSAAMSSFTSSTTSSRRSTTVSASGSGSSSAAVSSAASTTAVVIGGGGIITGDGLGATSSATADASSSSASAAAVGSDGSSSAGSRSVASLTLAGMALVLGALALMI